MNLLIFNQLLTQLSVHVVLEVANLLEQYVRRRYTMDISRAVKKGARVRVPVRWQSVRYVCVCVCVFTARWYALSSGTLS